MFVRIGRYTIILSFLLIAGSIIALAVFRVHLGIDFVGGSLMEIEYESTRPSSEEISKTLTQFDLSSALIQPAGEKGVIIRTKYIPEQLHQDVLGALGEGISERRFEAIGPVIGKELAGKTLWMILLSSLGIVLYIALAFRRSFAYLRSWQYSLASLAVTFHDIIIPMGAFAFLGEFQDVEITIPIVVGLLTVLGYSINDTIVVFDRIRENIAKKTGTDLEDTVNKSLKQTFGRSVNTSFTVLLVLIALYFFGGVTLKYFALVLIIGVVAGTYSSIFLAPPLLVLWRSLQKG